MGPRPAKRATRLPKDTDKDGLSDAEERKIGSSIHSKDSDGDGIDDKDEFFLGTNPTLSDTDNDGLSDRAEELLGTKGTEADSDGDGISDGVEVAYGTSPTNKIPVDPAVLAAERLAMRDKARGRDSDRDGIDDETERRIGTEVFLADSDGDGLSDRVEMIRLTDPTNPDSDFDQDWNDLGDVLRGKTITDDDSVLPKDYLNAPRADASEAVDADGELAGFISEERGQRLADRSDAELGTDVVPPRVRAALGWDDEPAGEVPDLAPPPGDVEILDHGISEPEFSQVADVGAPPSYDEAPLVASDDTSFATEEPIA